MSEGNKPYDPRSDKDWIDQVVKTFTWEETEGGWVFWGDCPRCGHGMFKEVVLTRRPVVAGASERALPAPARPETVQCNCTALHPGQGAEVKGCGACGVMELEL